jgi:enamine deaminase RidA (YjgF/YER057c/UK114 family)
MRQAGVEKKRVGALLAELGIHLPEATAPAGAFVPFVKTGHLTFLSGHIAKRSGLPWVGRLGESIALEEGRAAARAAAVDVLGTLARAADGLENVLRVVKVVVFVNSDATFTAQPAVADGASEVFQQVFGVGHARSAVGVSQLPLGACVEVELVAELTPARGKKATRSRPAHGALGVPHS